MDNYSLFREKYLELRHRYDVRIFSKDTKWKPLWVFINYFLMFVSFGKIKNFLTKTVTTLGPFIFYQVGWKMKEATKSDYVILCHEGDHVFMCSKLGCGSVVLGGFVMAILYLFVPLPIGLAWFRYAIERRAYLVSYRAWKQLGKPVSYEHYVELLTGPNYLWAWPFKKSVRAWFEKNC